MSSSSLNYLFERQYHLFGFISRAVENLKKVGAQNTKPEIIESRIEALKASWEKLQVNDDKICEQKLLLNSQEQKETEKFPYFKESLFETCEEQFIVAKGTMAALYHELRKDDAQAKPSAKTAPENGTLQGPRLPRIDLPKFNSDYSEWVPFRDLFTSLVRDNSSISIVEKLQYLKSCVTGTAAQRLKNIATTDANFQTAWDDLVAYYENKRVLVDAAMHSLFSAKNVTRESAAEIERLLSDVKQAIGSALALNRPIQHCDDFLVYLTVRKLDPVSIKDWERDLGSSTEPTKWDQLEKFLISRIRSLQAYERTAGKTRATPTTFASRQGQVKVHHATTSPSTKTCSHCGEDHYIASCPKYLEKTVEQRRDYITQRKLCFNCLGSHQVKACRTKERCRFCGSQHHSTIHRGNSVAKTPSQNTPLSLKTASPEESFSSLESSKMQPSTCGSVTSNVALSRTVECAPVLLATAIVKVTSYCGELVEARALLDQGSEISLVTESLTQRLRLPRSRSSIPIVGIGADSSRTSHGSIVVDLHSRVRPSFKCTVRACVLSKLTGYLPSAKVSDYRWPHLQNLELADPNFAQPGRVDMVLGADVYGLFLEEGIRKGPVEAPIAQQTSLGWILSGNVSTALSSSRSPSHSLQCSPDRELVDLLKKFWIQEEVFSVENEKLSPEDRQCEEHFLKTHSRNEEGRYIVRLPFKNPPKNLGDSLTVALKMLTRLEKRFAIDSDLQVAYSNFLKEYETLGHMRLVTGVSPESDRAYYLPHLCVIRPSSTTTKYRVVFNGSQKTDRGNSLNDCLHEGPKLLTDLADVITRCRVFQFVFSADIVKMFRQILVHKDDQDFQRILWRDRSGAIKTFALCTVTYGLTSAPFLANRTLRQLSADEGHRFPLAEGVIEKNTYVDDIFSGAHTLEEGREKIRQVIGLFKAGGFPLQKWKTNCDDMLREISSAVQESSLSVSLDSGPSHRTLGLTWQQDKDTFVFKFTNTSDVADVTKRTVLSCIAQLFDPLGWLAPVIVRAKIFMQELWSAQLGWDDSLPSHLASRWKEYTRQLADISLISVPRWIGLSPSVLGVELHGFSDASRAALGIAVYIRVLYDLDDARTALISAKSKVAPIKGGLDTRKRSRSIRVTTPRLELSAVVLLVQHITKLRRVLNFQTVPVYLWTDSTTALFWVQGPPSRWKEFVRNRVALVQEMLPDARWRHVPGEENPADAASRRLTPKQLAPLDLWWHGPTWLKQHSACWPSVTPPLEDVDLEERNHTVTHASSQRPFIVWDLIERYSRLTRLLRITAWCFRVVARFRHRVQYDPVLALTPKEVNEARLYWIKATQQSYFSTEVQHLSKGDELPRSSPLFRLVPFLDSHKMLRIGGRLRNSLLDPDTKHPLILPRNSALTSLILDHIHRLTLHGGTQIMLATLRRSYWIVGGRAPVRSFVLRCVTCARHRAATATQLMGQLPTSRTLPTRPFLHSGVVYAGPYTLKTWRGRAAKTYKGYLVVFVCFSSSAVHLELATDYSTAGFLAAFKRFTGRRGICATITSDCGTNFAGADAELRRLFDSSSRELANLANLLATDGTKWNFNPPAAPHFGGKWEAAMKSVKFHLRRTIDDAILTYEEFSTLLVQIEGVLNSRPICPLSDDPEDVNALTPGHFLIGDATTTVLEPTLSKLPESHLSRWQLIRQMLERFWQRWSTEYLQRFQGISKWRRTGSSIKVGSLVLVADERYPPSKWPLARVVKTHQGKDGLVRVVTIRTQCTTLKRPIVKLCPLPIPAGSS